VLVGGRGCGVVVLWCCGVVVLWGGAFAPIILPDIVNDIFRIFTIRLEDDGDDHRQVQVVTLVEPAARGAPGAGALRFRHWSFPLTTLCGQLQECWEER